MNKKVLIAMLIIPFSISGCSYQAIGIYSYSHAFWGEELTISDDGTFQYQTGNDDFSDNCEVYGKWTIDDTSPRLLVTEADRVEVGEYTDNCDGQARTKTWRLKQNTIVELDSSGKRVSTLERRQDGS